MKSLVASMAELVGNTPLLKIERISLRKYGFGFIRTSKASTNPKNFAVG